MEDCDVDAVDGAVRSYRVVQRTALLKLHH